MTIIDLSEWLQSELDKRDWRPAKLAEKAGLDPAIISRALGAERMPTPESLSAIARALGLPAKAIYRAAGLLPPEPETSPAFEELEHLFSQLPERDQDEILQIARLKLEREENANSKRRRAKTDLRPDEQ